MLVTSPIAVKTTPTASKPASSYVAGMSSDIDTVEPANVIGVAIF